MSELKDRIKEIRVRDHITQNDFAKRINATPGFISNVENGRSGLSDEKIQAIVLSFHVSEEWLRHGDGAMTPFGQDQSQGNKEEVGIRIKRIRKQKELSQDEFAKKIGVHKNRVYAVETGKAVPSKSFLNKVVRAFNISYDWLVTGEGDMENHERVDDKLIEWMNAHPEVIREIRERAGLSPSSPLAKKQREGR
jgi:transcriptional regulator with XRE-family HTH domain